MTVIFVPQPTTIRIDCDLAGLIMGDVDHTPTWMRTALTSNLPPVGSTFAVLPPYVPVPVQSVSRGPADWLLWYAQNEGVPVPRPDYIHTRYLLGTEGALFFEITVGGPGGVSNRWRVPWGQALLVPLLQEYPPRTALELWPDEQSVFSLARVTNYVPPTSLPTAYLSFASGVGLVPDEAPDTAPALPRRTIPAARTLGDVIDLERDDA